MAETLARGRDIGRLQNLRRYERARIGDNRLMLAAMQGFKSLFGSELPLACELRNTGLALTDQLPLLKNLFMQHATGL